MNYGDIHLHALFGADDGAGSEKEMRQMVDLAYADGERLLCLTPHYHPGYFGDNRKKSEEAFASLQSYASDTYPDLKLYLGNELRYSPDCISWLDDGACRSLGGTNRVLVDFSTRESGKNIVGGLERLLGCGYAPVLAHAERYEALWHSGSILRELRADGVLLQVDTQSIFGGFGFRTKLQAKAILGGRLADLVASDAHDLRRRVPGLDRAYRYIAGKYSENYAKALCWDVPERLLKKD